jgi:hypothetical protein
MLRKTIVVSRCFIYLVRRSGQYAVELGPSSEVKIGMQKLRKKKRHHKQLPYWEGKGKVLL